MDTDELIIARLLNADPKLDRDFTIATRVLGYAEPYVVYGHRDRRTRAHPKIAFRVPSPTAPGDARNFLSWFDRTEKEISPRVCLLPRYEEPNGRREILRVMEERGYNYLLVRLGTNWLAQFFGTNAVTWPTVKSDMDATTAEEAIARAAWRMAALTAPGPGA